MQRNIAREPYRPETVAALAAAVMKFAPKQRQWRARMFVEIALQCDLLDYDLDNADKWVVHRNQVRVETKREGARPRVRR